MAQRSKLVVERTPLYAARAARVDEIVGRFGSSYDRGVKTTDFVEKLIVTHAWEMTLAEEAFRETLAEVGRYVEDATADAEAGLWGNVRVPPGSLTSKLVEHLTTIRCQQQLIEALGLRLSAERRTPQRGTEG